MRILHVDSGREYRGGQEQVRLLVRELARRGAVEQRLVTGRGGTLARRAAADGLAVREVPWRAGLDPRAWGRLVAESLAWRPDLLHAHNGHAATLALWTRAALRVLAPRRAPRLVVTRRVVFPPGPANAARRADAVIAISDAVRAALCAAGLPAAAIRVVPSGVDPDEVRAAAVPPLAVRAGLGLPDSAPLAASVAALEPAKDHRTLLRAAAAARALRPDLHWVIAGDGPERAALAAEIRRLGLERRVHLLGHVPRADALLRECDLLVVTSRAEGLGTVVLRALALGTPVVATRAGGLPELVPEPWLVPVGDAEALARAVARALAHPPRVALPARYTAAAMADGVMAVYRSLA